MRTHHRPCHNPCMCVIAPHMLDSVLKNGSDVQRASAADTLASDRTFRAMRFQFLASGQGLSFPSEPTTAATTVKQRCVYTASGQERLPGDMLVKEGDPPHSDMTVREAYDGLGHVWDFYNQLFGRDSINGHGLPMDATVHYGHAYDNAFWNSAQMVFGDGDGSLFKRFTIALDVIGHELTHGVTETTAGLDYVAKPGALNESVSDVFGLLIKQWVLGQSASQADWLIGVGLLADGVRSGNPNAPAALRSAAAPGTAYNDPVLGKDPQPATMRSYYHGTRDNMGVHINSGIPNHAAYLAAMRIGGNAWQTIGPVWYRTLTDDRLAQNCGFSRFAGLTVANAGTLFGEGSDQQRAVQESWQEVLVKPFPYPVLAPGA